MDSDTFRFIERQLYNYDEFRNDAKFISESREALPHYIKRTMEAEDLLKATLEQLDVDCRTCVWGNKCYQCKRQKLIDRIKDYLG